MTVLKLLALLLPDPKRLPLTHFTSSKGRFRPQKGGDKVA